MAKAKLTAAEGVAVIEALTAFCIRSVDPATPVEVKDLGRDLHAALRYPPGRDVATVVRGVLDKRAANAANSSAEAERGEA